MYITSNFESVHKYLGECLMFYFPKIEGIEEVCGIRTYMGKVVCMKFDFLGMSLEVY